MLKRRTTEREARKRTPYPARYLDEDEEAHIF